MRKPFEFTQLIQYTLTVRADSLEEAEGLADFYPLKEWNKSEKLVRRVAGGEQLYMCLKCGNPTAEKRPDLQGWDGFCSKCGIIAQSQVGEISPPHKLEHHLIYRGSGSDLATDIRSVVPHREITRLLDALKGYVNGD